jgi:hypothetical protein
MTHKTTWRKTSFKAAAATNIKSKVYFYLYYLMIWIRSEFKGSKSKEGTSENFTFDYRKHPKTGPFLVYFQMRRPFEYWPAFVIQTTSEYQTQFKGWVPLLLSSFYMFLSWTVLYIIENNCTIWKMDWSLKWSSFRPLFENRALNSWLV